ncbi:hypothetical protein M3Y99_01022100 [Aphelenchoides fujianensis]|nr:hypothetical protein M3Y99_01022100 [Aphelenchoides fujianensis]
MRKLLWHGPEPAKVFEVLRDGYKHSTIQNVTPPIKVPAAELMKTEETEFAFDEYAVYAANQIKHKYLVKVEIVPK